MKSRLLFKVQIGLVLAAFGVYTGLLVYTSHKYAGAFAEAQLGVESQIVKHRFGVPPDHIEFPHSGYLLGFTMFPCSTPCNERLVWDDPTSLLRAEAYYFEFDVDRHLIRKTHYEHLDEAYLRSEERRREGEKRTRKAGLDWSSTEAERFRAARVVVLGRLREPPEFSPGDYSWLSRFLIVRSWKGPFRSGATISVTTEGTFCFRPDCPPFSGPSGQLVVLFGLGDTQPVSPIIEDDTVDQAQIENTTGKIDALATLAGT